MDDEKFRIPSGNPTRRGFLLRAAISGTLATVIPGSSGLARNLEGVTAEEDSGAEENEHSREMEVSTELWSKKVFIGTFVEEIDTQGRISVPLPFRMVIQAKGLAGIALYPSLTDPCIEGCGLDRIEMMAENLPDGAPSPSMKQDSITHLIIGTAREMPFDVAGRIVLPVDFMDKVGLRKEAMFVGKGRIFQIWEPRALTRSQAVMKQLSPQSDTNLD